MSSAFSTQLPIAPLGAGDLIDRAVRLYRRHLWTLMRIASIPVIISAIGSIFQAIAYRKVFKGSDASELVIWIPILILAWLLGVSGHIFNLIVMGGATRNLVSHLLRNEAVSVRATYSAVRARFWPLLLATFIILGWAIISAAVSLVAFYFVMGVAFLGIFGLAQVLPNWLTTIVAIVVTIGGLIPVLYVFFFLIGRVAYVPQVLLVEGRGVFASVGRSFSLARGNVRRLMAMTLFVTFATYAVLWILILPLGWYGYINGVDPNPLSSINWPIWYSIGYNVLVPLSSIMLAPVWMLGLSLLYVDERVRHEGYDIELMAARQLSEMPRLNVESPFGPAISDILPKAPNLPPRPSASVLGLK
jgi:hypothetical protein